MPQFCGYEITTSVRISNEIFTHDKRMRIINCRRKFDNFSSGFAKEREREKEKTLEIKYSENEEKNCKRKRDESVVKRS